MINFVDFFNCKRGSVSIFIVIAFASFILVASIFFAAAKSASSRSYADAAFQLAGRSVLSEYDRKLLEDYGIMAFRGDEKIIEDDIKYYAGASLNSDNLIYSLFRKGSKDHIDSVDSKTGDITANLKEYSLLDVDNFEDQITSGFVSKWLENRIDNGKRIQNDPSEKDEKGRNLKDGNILSALPSDGYPVPLLPSFEREEDMPLWEDVIQSGTTNGITTEYILSVFSNNLYSLDTETRFFKNEVEYIIEGEEKDDENYDDVMFKIAAIRAAVNGAFLYFDAKKKAEIEAAAVVGGILTAGYGYEASKVIITGLWLAAETRNDLQLLEAGKKIPLFKTEAGWALDNVKDIADGLLTDEPVVALSGGLGLGYEDHLRIFLYMTDREVKLLRIMDLIQINMKGNYYKEFSIREHYVGFRVECEYDKDKFSYIQKY